jgi:hypothetical protein
LASLRTLIATQPKRPIFYFLLLFLFCSSSQADTLTEDFSTGTHFSSGPAIANPVTGVLHPPLEVSNHQTACDGAPSSVDINFGAGIHGPFNSTNYSRFGTVTGSGPYTIAIDTDQFPVLYVTSFTLSAGDTIAPTGSKPLVIKAMGSVDVSGTIDCSGGNGTNGAPSPASLSSGGSGRCGGGNGGDGATTGSVAQPGSAGIATVISGGGGGAGTLGAGGGGGAGFNWTVACGTPGTSAVAGAGGGGGAAGANYEDSAFRVQGGGAGGGGGAIGGGFSGGGGGAGGGHVEIYAIGNIDVTATGSIKVNGGNGGASAGGSGGGGGGAAGSIRLASGGLITVAGGATRISLGNGGLGGTSATGSAGGNGAMGRDWIIDSLGDACFAPECDAQNLGIAAASGAVLYKLGLTTTYSSVYDLQNHHTTFSNQTQTVINAGSGAVTITTAGSRNGFSVDSTAYEPVATIANLAGSRYVIFKIDINNTNAGTPIIVDLFDLTYTPGPSTEFNYTAGCGSIGKSNLSGGMIALTFLLFLLPVFVLGYLRFRHQEIPNKIPS